MEICRYNSNPILTKKDVPFKVNSIFNPGAAKIKDKYVLVCRTEMPNGRSSFTLAWSDDGINFKVDSKPCLNSFDHKDFNIYTEWGIEDTRVTKIENNYYLTYTAYSRFMPLVMLSETSDFKDFNILGPISEPSNKDCALFPEKINDNYWKVDRPSAGLRSDMWISSSPDLIHWGNFKLLTEPFYGTWENDKIGNSTPPIRTKEGWLVLYHGVRGFGISSIYKIGVMLLDLEKPWIIKGRSEEPILSPETNYERIGDVGNVVFSNGWILEDNGEIKIYYSGADTNICLATSTIDELLSICK